MRQGNMLTGIVWLNRKTMHPQTMTSLAHRYALHPLKGFLVNLHMPSQLVIDGVCVYMASLSIVRTCSCWMAKHGSCTALSCKNDKAEWYAGPEVSLPQVPDAACHLPERHHHPR